MTTEYEMCEHGRHIGSVCLPCAEKDELKMIYDKNPDDRFEYVDPYDMKPEPVEKKPYNGRNLLKRLWALYEKTNDYAAKKAAVLLEEQGYADERFEKKQESGLDAPYYDFPDNIHSAMDLIEWLNLDFSQGNILKSIIRENNPNAKKKTTAMYEAEKQYYYSSRRLRSLQEKEADSS